MSGKIREDSIADELKGTQWDYSQRFDRSFLLKPIGEIFGTFCWDDRSNLPVPSKKDEDQSESDD